MTQHAASYGVTILLLHSTHHHTKVIGLNHHAGSLGFQVFLKGISNFSGEPLLHLQSAAENIDEAGDLA